MQISITIKKTIAIARVWLSILKNNIYVSVSDIAIFLNAFFGTYTITGQKINEMLQTTDYQRTKSEEELKRDDLIDIKYVPLVKAIDFERVDKIIRDNAEIYRLVWKARIILDIFDINFEEDELRIMDCFCKWSYEYNLINTEKDDIDYNVLEENIKYLIEEFRKVNNNE